MSRGGGREGGGGLEFKIKDINTFIITIIFFLIQTDILFSFSI